MSRVMDRDKLGYDYDTQLYNRADDPDELTNVAEQNPEVVADLGARIDRYLASGEGMTDGTFNAKEDYAPPRAT